MCMCVCIYIYIYTHTLPSLATKVNVYKATVLPSLLYGSETWPTLAHHIRRLEVFHQRSLRQIMNIKWWHRVTNTEVLERANCSSIESMIRRSRLRWLGHVSRMDNSRIPKQLLFGELKLGKCNRGRPHKRWKDCIKEDLRAFQIDLKTWYKVAQDRCLWRRALFSGLETCELRLRERAAEQRKRRHQRATDPPSSWFDGDLIIISTNSVSIIITATIIHNVVVYTAVQTQSRCISIVCVALCYVL